MKDGAPLAGRCSLCRQAVAPALLHFAGKVTHGLLRDDAPRSSGQRRLGLIHCGQDRCPGALALFPQSKSLLYRFFFALEASAFDGLSDKRLLVWSELYFHRL